MEFLRKIFVLLGILIAVSCLFRENTLYLPEENPEGPLKISGLYYMMQDTIMYSFILYENGLYLYSFGSQCNTIKCQIDLIRKYSSRDTEMNFYDYQGSWGVYSIFDGRIRIKRYFGIGFASYGIQELEGEILNDTTIRITHFNNRRKEESATYHFYAFSPKPDSTNQFIDYR